jgi:hypothetical protein
MGNNPLMRVRGLGVLLRSALERGFPGTYLCILPIMIALSGACIFSTILRSQQITTKLPQFEAVSIRPTNPDRVGNSGFLADGYRGENVALAHLILGAYGLHRRHQILGLPKWTESAHYAIVAKVGESDMPVRGHFGFHSGTRCFSQFSKIASRCVVTGRKGCYLCTGLKYQGICQTQ